MAVIQTFALNKSLSYSLIKAMILAMLVILQRCYLD